MYLESIELAGFKSFAKKSELEFSAPITAVVGPNGSGKSNVAEGFRFVLGEQSMKSMRSRRGEDLIWGGSNSVPRMNRAEVTVAFDNSRRLFELDFDEIRITRVVHRDGINEYQINGSVVRLKDVVELLAKANIGASGHHIISQGEADRVLSASPKERREIVEDSLGLKIFQYKRMEAERKLHKTEENVKQVASLRREIAPHIKYLEKQVEKIRQTEEFREDLKEKLLEYLAREERYIKRRRADLVADLVSPTDELVEVDRKLSLAKGVLEQSTGHAKERDEILAYERRLEEMQKLRDELSREMGRVEGQIEYAKKQGGDSESGVIARASLKELVDSAEKEIAVASAGEIRNVFDSFLGRIKKLLSGDERRDEIDSLKKEYEVLQGKLASLESEEGKVKGMYDVLRKRIEESKDEERSAERAVFELSARKRDLEESIRTLKRNLEELKNVEESFKREMEEGAVLAGRAVLQFSNHSFDFEEESRAKQDERRHAIERVKIRIEEFGAGGGEDTLKEYEEATERDRFLESEIADLEHSATNLKQLIEDLEIRLNEQFLSGIKKINTEFQRFFELLFGGGEARLSLIKQKRPNLEEDEDEPQEEGIDIGVSLPRKKIRGLEMLSGGERALTSIALLFAMSQVNPPPFLILDETDAALDEANSRKYSAMIKELSKRTQLILITHNRETMSAAGILYGVTMGSDGVSKLLSVKFEEAVKVAK